MSKNIWNLVWFLFHDRPLTQVLPVPMQLCRDTGSVYFREWSIVAQNSTYIMPSYKIPCNGIVLGREFCHYRVDVPAATFYPSVWRLDGSSYKLIHASFVPQVLSGFTFACTRYIQPSLVWTVHCPYKWYSGLVQWSCCITDIDQQLFKWYSYFLQYNRESQQH